MDYSVWVVVRSKVAGSKLVPSLGEISTKHIHPSDFRLVGQGAIDDIYIFAGVEFVAKERVHSMGKARRNLVRTCQPLIEYVDVAMSLRPGKVRTATLWVLSKFKISLRR